MRGGKEWWFAAAIVAALVALLFGYKLTSKWSADGAAAAAPEPSETVQAATATIRQFAPQSRSIGTIAATEIVELRNEIAGTVVEVGFGSGQRVAKGAMLVRFDTREERARLAAQSARAALAAKNLERAQALSSRGFVSQSRIDLLASELATTRAEADALRAIIAKKEISAPFAARAGIHDLHAGQYLAEGSAIATLQGVGDRLYVDFSLPQDAAAAVRPGHTVRVSGTGLPAVGLTAQVMARDAAASDARMVRYRASVTNAGDLLMPGSFVDVTLPVARSAPTIFVPRTAISQKPHAAYLFLLQPDNAVEGALRARQRVVKLGPVVGDHVAILTGLKGGERIAADGAFKLRDGALVQVATLR